VHGAVEIACDLFARTLERLDPSARVAAALRDIELSGEVIVLAAGKAAARMSMGAAQVLGDRIAGGVVVVPEAEQIPPGLTMRVGSHPVANPASERAGRALLDAARRVGPDQSALALVSGGASALAAVPAPGLELADKNFAVSAVMASGAPIEDINVVRKHLSAIKGGRLAVACRGPMLSLISSDVVGDDLASIGSGPTVPDPSTNADALAILERTGLSLPRQIVRHLSSSADTPKRLRPEDGALLVAGTGTLVDAAVTAREGVEELGRGVVGDVELVAGWLVAAARAAAADAARTGRPVIGVAGGECTIRLPASPGQGGRAQQLALLVARGIAGVDGVGVLCAGSDGIDGNTTAAGAVVDGATWSEAGHDPAGALERCDAYSALDAADALVVTGRTGVNHADLFIVTAVPC
jgi:hydroxypyruvate reductase